MMSVREVNASARDVFFEQRLTRQRSFFAAQNYSFQHCRSRWRHYARVRVQNKTILCVFQFNAFTRRWRRSSM